MKCRICDVDMGDSFAVEEDTLKAVPCGDCQEAIAECHAHMDEEHHHTALDEESMGFGDSPVPKFFEVTTKEHKDEG